MRIIASKYRSQCRRCEQVVEVGENVYWEKNKGVFHLNCYDNDIQTELQQNNLEKKNYLLLILRAYMFLAPLTYGPVFYVRGMSDAIMYCISGPLLIAIFTGLKPTNYKLRVKWATRRARLGDVFVTIILFETIMSFGLTWLFRNLVFLLR